MSREISNPIDINNNHQTYFKNTLKGNNLTHTNTNSPLSSYNSSISSNSPELYSCMSSIQSSPNDIINKHNGGNKKNEDNGIDNTIRITDYTRTNIKRTEDVFKLDKSTPNHNIDNNQDFKISHHSLPRSNRSSNHSLNLENISENANSLYSDLLDLNTLHSQKSTKSSSQQNHSSVIVSKEEIKAMENTLCKPLNLRKIMENTDDLILSLKVISEIQPNERISTSNGILIHQSDDHFISAKRWYLGESRTTNIKVIESIFTAAFIKISDALHEREQILNEFVGPDIQSKTPSEFRRLVMGKLNNKQLIDRIKNCIIKAKNNIGNLKTTYSDDQNAKARIDAIREKSDGKIKLVEKSIELLDTFCKKRCVCT